MPRHREIWRMTLGGWPLKYRGKSEARPLDVYITPELLLIKGIVNFPDSANNREIRIEFHRDGNGVDTAHRVIDVLQDWIRSHNNG